MMTHRICMILPVLVRAAGNRIAEAQGWGANNYTVPLLTGPLVTHYGLSSFCDEAFLASLSGAGEGIAPEGCDPADIAAVMPVLLVSVEPLGTRPAAEQFDALCAAHGLSRIPSEDL